MHRTLMNVTAFLAIIFFFGAESARAGSDPSAPDYDGRDGVMIYVSKMGDDSDGRSWATAFHTIQKALDALPDDKGGHRLILRPDTYAEANLSTPFRGAKDAYNAIVGDFDGSLGSGAKGWTVIDSGAALEIVRTNPKAPTGNPTYMILKEGDPLAENGLKSVDWYCPWRCDPEISGVMWDRWVYRHLYVTGSEAGLGWDLTREKGSEFSVLVEDCVGIGRFAGACVIDHKPRVGEPVVFRRCHFANLDWWGDAGAAYVRGGEAKMPEQAHAYFEDCTLVSPDNALQAAYPGVDDRYTRVSFKRCRLVVLNFSQPHGTPSSGILCCGAKDGRQLHVDLDDCTLMGFKLFGAPAGNVSYSLAGQVAAYVQYRQPIPEGFVRLRYWPVSIFATTAPPVADADLSKLPYLPDEVTAN